MTIAAIDHVQLAMPAGGEHEARNFYGELLGLPDAVQSLSPFWHLADVPADDFDVVPFVALLVLAAAFVAAGLWGYRRRDAVTG